MLAWGFVVLSAGESGVRAQPSAEFSFPFPFPFTALLQEGTLLSSIPESVLFCQSWAAPKHPLGGSSCHVCTASRLAPEPGRWYRAQGSAVRGTGARQCNASNCRCPVTTPCWGWVLLCGVSLG